MGTIRGLSAAFVLCVMASGCTRHDYFHGSRYNLDHGNAIAARRVPADGPSKGEAWTTQSDPEAFGAIRGGGPSPGAREQYPGGGD